MLSPLLALSLCGMLHAAPVVSENRPPLGSSWNPTEDPYVLDGSSLISPWHQYLMTELATTGGAAGGFIVTGGILLALYGPERVGDAQPLGMSTSTLAGIGAAAGGITAAGFTAAAFRPTQTPRSSTPAFVGAATGGLIGLGIGIPVVLLSDDKRKTEFSNILFGFALPVCATSLGAVLGDLSGEPSRPDKPKSPRGFHPIGIRPTWTLEGTGGLAVTVPLDL